MPQRLSLHSDISWDLSSMSEGLSISDVLEEWLLPPPGSERVWDFMFERDRL